MILPTKVCLILEIWQYIFGATPYEEWGLVVTYLIWVDPNSFLAMKSNTNLVYYTPCFNKVERGVYWFHLVHLSVRLSIRLWMESCPLCILHNTSWIHFIFTHLIKKLQKVCHVQIFNSNFSSFDLGSNMNQSYGNHGVGVGMGVGGILRTEAF